MVMLPPPGLAITSRKIDATILGMQKSGPSKDVFCKFSYKRLVLCSIADLLGVYSKPKSGGKRWEIPTLCECYDLYQSFFVSALSSDVQLADLSYFDQPVS